MRPAVLFLLAAVLPAQTIPPAELRRDLDVLRLALVEGHPALYQFQPQAEFDQSFREAAALLGRPLTVEEFYRILAPLVTGIRCGHTRLFPPDATMKAIDTQSLWFPFDVAVLDGRVFIRRDYHSEGERLAGAEVLTINGTPAAEVLRRLYEIWSRDGDVESSRPWRMGLGGAFARLLEPATGLKAPFHLELRQKSKVSKVDVPGLLRKRILELQRARHPEDMKPESSASATLLDDGKLAVVAMASLTGISDEEQPRSMPVFVEQTFRQMSERGTGTLILDLRNNGGGNNELAKVILAHLLDRPFDFYREVTLNALQFSFAPYAQPSAGIPSDLARRRPDGRYDLVNHPNWSTQAPREPGFRGRVFVLANGGTFSSAAELVSLLAEHKRALIIGEETGGAVGGNSSGFMPRITLPHSRIVMQLPLVSFRLAVNPDRNPRRGVMPDRPVHYSIEDLLASRDNEMDLAIELARGSGTAKPQAK